MNSIRFDFTTISLPQRSAITRIAVVVIVALIIIIAAFGVAYYFAQIGIRITSTTSSSTTSPRETSSSSAPVTSTPLILYSADAYVEEY